MSIKTLCRDLNIQSLYGIRGLQRITDRKYIPLYYYKGYKIHKEKIGRINLFVGLNNEYSRRLAYTLKDLCRKIDKIVG